MSVASVNERDSSRSDGYRNGYPGLAVAEFKKIELDFAEDDAM